ncbi:MAG: DUF2523 family protein [Mucilaginibacter sp.]
MALLDSISHFFDWLTAWFSHGLYDFAVWAFTGFVKYATVAALEFVLWSVPFAFDVARQIMTDLNINAYLQTAWAGLDSQYLSYATILQIPAAVNILVSGAITRYVTRFIPFI